MKLNEILNEIPWIKAFLHWLITPDRNPRPRLWVKWFVNPFIHKRGKKSRIRRRTRIDVFPWKKFEIGKLTTIEDFCTINNGSGDVILGDRVRVGIGSVIIGPVKMGHGSGLGQHVFVAGFNHGYKDGSRNSSTQPLVVKETIIEEDSHIGANSVVLAGVHIGKRCQIGAGSVVTKDIPSFSIAVGNPAKVIKQYSPVEKKWIRVIKNNVANLEGV